MFLLSVVSLPNTSIILTTSLFILVSEIELAKDKVISTEIDSDTHESFVKAVKVIV